MSGFDAGKKVKGRKRSLIIVPLGLLLAVTATAASVQDREAAADVAAQAVAQAPGLQKLYTGAAHGGQCARTFETAPPNMRVELVRHPGHHSTGTWHDAQQSLWPEGLPVVLSFRPSARGVERAPAWNKRARRLMAPHDRSSWAQVAWVWRVEARILATRLTQ